MNETIKNLFDGITESSWEWAEFFPSEGKYFLSVSELCAFMAESAKKSDSLDLYGVVAKEPNGQVTICFTGNGPKSKAHANFIGNAPAAIKHLLDENESLRAKISEAENKAISEYAKKLLVKVNLHDPSTDGEGNTRFGVDELSEFGEGALAVVREIRNYLNEDINGGDGGEG